MNADNCEELKNEDLDGFLVGGAALKPDFLKIIACMESHYKLDQQPDILNGSKIREFWEQKTLVQNSLAT